MSEVENKKEEVLGKAEGKKNGPRIASRADRLSNACHLIRFDKRGPGLSDRHTPLRSGPNSFPHIGRSQILVARTFG
jgi:hypothetical protein